MSTEPANDGNVTFQTLVDKSGAELERAVEALVARMTLSEKIAQMSTETSLVRHVQMIPRYNLYTYDSGTNKRLGIPPIKFTDGPRGIALNHSTCFPVSMARGATWDVGLEERVGEVMGIEARSQGANYFGGVCINLLRHPAGGRAQETFGEDPRHVGDMAVGFIKGLQRHVMACAKHYALNSIERSRFYVDVKADERTLRELYLPHFKDCVDAGVASIMSAYNKVNGHYCGHNKNLLTEILKDDWGFEGFVVSDFLAGIRSPYAAAAGLDIEMPLIIHYGKRLEKLVKKGKIPIEKIDDSVKRIVRTKARFHKVGDPSMYDKSKVASKEHAALAREVAQKAIVLLKNENGALPIDPGVKKIALFGKIATMANIGDPGSSKVRPPYVVTALEGMKKRCGSAVELKYVVGDDTEEARKAAQEADVAVVVTGLSGRDEGEYVPIVPKIFELGGDRKSLGLAADQIALIKIVAAANKRTVVVLEGGSAIMVEPWIDDVGALVMAWYPGMEGSNAIADVLFGDVNPSGKLPIAFAASADQLPFFDDRAKTIDYDLYHGYRLADRKSLKSRFAFGYGMSYTTYKYGDMKIDSDKIAPDGRVKVEVSVTNTGKIAGDEIVQLYVAYHAPSVDRPPKELKGFAKLSLKPGETKVASFVVEAKSLAFYDTAKKAWVVDKKDYTVMVGPSSRAEDLTLAKRFTIA